MSERLSGVTYSLNGVPNTEPVRSFYIGRNGKIAQNIAEQLGLQFEGLLDEHTRPNKNRYLVPAATLIQEDVPFKSASEFYGTMVENREHVEKAILHPSISDHTPSFYSAEFSKRVTENGFVLPGYSVFHADDVFEAYRKFSRQYQPNLRLKLPDKSDGHGQYTVHTEADIRHLLSFLNTKDISEKGIVLEPNLLSPSTTSVGFINIGEQMYSFIAHQKNDIVSDENEEERSRYAGAFVRVLRAPMDSLEEIAKTDEEYTAVQKALGFYNTYSLLSPVSSRLSFDVLSGYDTDGNNLSGVTDITARLGGTCPALMEALRAFKHSAADRVDTEVTLNYNVQNELPEEQGATIYVDHPELKITAKAYV